MSDQELFQAVLLASSPSSSSSTSSSSSVSKASSSSLPSGADTEDTAVVAEPVWTTRLEISLAEKMIELVTNSNNTITRTLFDQQVLQHMLDNHSMHVTSAHIKERLHRMQSRATRLKKENAEKDPQMIEWRKQKAEYEAKQQLDREKKQNRRRSLRRRSKADQEEVDDRDDNPIPSFPVECPIQPPTAIMNSINKCMHKLSAMTTQWSQEEKEKKEREKERKQVERKQKRMQEKKQRMVERQPSTSTDSSSSSDSPAKKNTFSIATNTKFYMEYMHEQSKETEALIRNITQSINEQAAHREKEAAATAAYRAEKLRLLRLAYETKQNKENMPPVQ